jgi:ABC-2 type transport system ATP-binding protein
VRELSHGMRRRLAVAQAFLGDPELVLLDEPTGGLDPHLVVEMRDVLRAEANKRTLVVSTHILGDIESTCDHVAFLEAGKCVKSGRIEDVTRRRGLVRIRLGEPIDLATVADVLEGRAPRIDDDELRYVLFDGEDAADAQGALLVALVERGAKILEVRLGDSLEAAYLASREG